MTSLPLPPPLLPPGSGSQDAPGEDPQCLHLPAPWASTLGGFGGSLRTSAVPSHQHFDLGCTGVPGDMWSPPTPPPLLPPAPHSHSPEPRHGAATRGQCGNTDARPPARGGPSPQRAAPPSPPAARPHCSGEETRAGGSGRSRITPPGCVRLGKSLPVSQPQAPYLQGCGEVPRASGNGKLITWWSLFLV